MSGGRRADGSRTVRSSPTADVGRTSNDRRDGRRGGGDDRAGDGRPTGGGESGGRLDEAVARFVEDRLGRPVSRAAVRRIVMAGAVRVDGRPARRPGMPVPPGARLEVTVDPGRIDSERQRSRAASGVEAPAILFEDGCLLAVAKPPGIPIHPTADPSRDDFFTAVRRWLAAARPALRLAPDGLPALALHHRLDVDTSGVVLFNTDPRVNARLTGLFAAREVEKVYHALTGAGGPAGRDRWRSASRLAPVGAGRSARMRSVRKGGQEAVTSFRVVERLAGALLVDARPETGRKHQVRAHLAESGLPVLGDRRYGGARRVGSLAVPRVMLHAFRLTLPHPDDGRPVAIECPHPSDFATLLGHLRRGLPL